MAKAAGWIGVGLGLTVLGGSIWWLARPAEGAAAAEARPPFVLPVTLTEVVRGDLRPRALLNGTVRAARRASLAFEAAGTVRALFAEEAGAVEQGARLAELENRDEQLEMAESQAALSLSERELELLQAGEREEEKRRLLAVLEATRAEEDLARSEVERAEKLSESKVISDSEQDRRRTEFRAAEKRRVAAEELYARALAGARAEDLAIARARVEAARTRVDTSRHELEKTTLLAPWSGRVVRRLVSAGDYVSIGDPVYELVDLDNLEIHIEVPGRLAGRMGAQTRARVQLPGGESLETDLDALIPAADELSRSFRAIVRLDAEDNRLGLLSPGMSVDVEILLEPLNQVLLVPSDAVLAGSRGTYVVRASPLASAGATDGAGTGLQAEFVPVRVLVQEGGVSAVEPPRASRAAGEPPATVAELVAGDSLVLTGADNAFPGAALRPLPPETPGTGGPR